MPAGQGELRKEWVKWRAALPPATSPSSPPFFSLHHAGREGGRGMSGVKPYSANQNESLRPLKVERGCVLENGRIVLSDTASALTQNPRVKAAYLGG